MSDVSTTSSGMTGAGGGNKLRITGMASGLDVDAMVKKMMTAEQTKLDKAKQNKQYTQWKQEAYQDIIKDVKDLQSSFFDSMSSDKNVLSASNFSPYIVSGLNGNAVDTSVATFTPGVGAQTGKYSISFKNSSGTQDGQLAELAAVSGNPNSIYATAKGFTGDWTGQKIAFSVDGGPDLTITLQAATTVDAAITDINNQIDTDSSLSALKGKVQAVKSSNGQIQFKTLTDTSVKISDSANTTVADVANLKGRSLNPSKSTTMGDLGLTTDDKLEFSYNNITYTVDVKTTDKISDVINNISAKTSGKVTGKYSQLDGSFTLQTVNTGASENLQLKTVTNAAKALGLSSTTAKQGKDAIVYITPPGATSSTKVVKSSNNFTIDGMSYSLASVGDASVTVGTDTSKVYDKINDFITKYNTLVDKIQTKLTEKKNSDYKPLTDAQKQSMSSSEITAWEAKAKVGILRKDSNLQGMFDDLRSAFTTAIANTQLKFGQYSSDSIGIDMSNDYDKPGHIDMVDASKLKTAIANHPDEVLKMFTNVSNATTATGKPYDATSQQYREDGIFKRVKTIFEKNVGATNVTLNTAVLTSYANKQYDFSSSGSGGKNTIPDQLYQEQLLISKIQTSMSEKQEQYYKKFSQLETAMNTLSAQQAQLSSLNGQ